MLARLLVAVLLWLGAVAALSPLKGAPALLSARSPLLAAKQRGNLDPARYGRRGNLTLGFQPFAAHGLFERDLFKRECVDAGYEPCSNSEFLCCPAGDVCTADGCCSAGEEQCQSNGCYTPGEETCCSDGTSCPNSEDCVGDGFCCPHGKSRCGDLFCYDAATEICCGSGEEVCEQDTTCCGDIDCCANGATCGADDFCTGRTCTETSTYRSTSYDGVHTVSVTQIEPPEGEEEAPEFSCAPITATNSNGDTLELGDDCLLTLSPSAAAASTSSSGGTGPSARAAPHAPLDAALPLATNAAADAAECFYTSTYISTYVVRALSTVTATVTEAEPDESFSCLPMSVTNANGDELSLDEECSLEFSPNTNAPSPTGGSSGGSGGSGGGLSGASGVAVARSMVAVPILVLVGIWVL